MRKERLGVGASKDQHLGKDQQILHLKDPNRHGHPDDKDAGETGGITSLKALSSKLSKMETQNMNPNASITSDTHDQNPTLARAKLAEGGVNKEASEITSQCEVSSSQRRI